MSDEKEEEKNNGRYPAGYCHLLYSYCPCGDLIISNVVCSSCFFQQLFRVTEKSGTIIMAKGSGNGFL